MAWLRCGLADRLRGGIGAQRRKVQRERRAFAWHRPDGNASTVRLPDAVDETETEAVAVDLPIDRVLAAIERVEDVREVVGIDAASVVADRELHFRPLRRSGAAHRHANPAAVGAVLDGVAQEILQ